MTAAAFVVAVWLGSGAWFVRLCTKGDPPAVSPGSRALAEDIEVASLDFAWSLPSYREGIHG